MHYIRKYLARTRHDYMTSEPRFYFQMQLDIQVVTFLFKDSEIVSDAGLPVSKRYAWRTGPIQLCVTTVEHVAPPRPDPFPSSFAIAKCHVSGRGKY